MFCNRRLLPLSKLYREYAKMYERREAINARYTDRVWRINVQEAWEEEERYTKGWRAAVSRKAAGE